MAYRNHLSTQFSMKASFDRLTERQKKVVLSSRIKDLADYVCLFQRKNSTFNCGGSSANSGF